MLDQLPPPLPQQPLLLQPILQQRLFPLQLPQLRQQLQLRRQQSSLNVEGLLLGLLCDRKSLAPLNHSGQRMPQLGQSLEKDHQTRLDRRQHRRLRFEHDQMRSPTDRGYESVAQSVDVQVRDGEPTR